jgi:CysZ protein
MHKISAIVPRFVCGLSSAFQGASFSLKHPKLWPFFALPLFISLSFIWGSWAAWDHMDDAVLSFLGGGEGDWWSRFLDGLSILIFAIFAWYSFTMVGMILASPFNDILAVEVMKIRKMTMDDPPFWEGVVRAISDTVKLTGVKLLFSLLAFAFPPLLFPFFVLVIGMDHFDYPWSHQSKGLRGRIACAKRDLWEFSGFSLFFGILMAVPFLGLMFMPLAVVSAALLARPMEELSKQDAIELKES